MTKVMQAAQVLLQLGWATGARRWINFKSKMNKVGNLLSQLLRYSGVVQRCKWNKWLMIHCNPLWRMWMGNRHKLSSLLSLLLMGVFSPLSCLQ